MPIHLYWGDDSGTRDRAIESLVTKIVDPTWMNMNLSRLDGNDSGEINKVFDEIRTPAFGNGGRAVIVQRSPFCNNCSIELGKKFIDILSVIPAQNHLILINSTKPDGRLKTTKILKSLIESKQMEEKSFLLPAIWDGAGQRKLVEKTASELGLLIEEEAIFALVEAIGNDSSKLFSELEKIALLQESKNQAKNIEEQKISIKASTVNELIAEKTSNAFQIGDYLLEDKRGEAISNIEILLNAGEPPLRILASLTTQTRGWLWVSLLESEGQKDVSLIAKTAGIANPKRIYVIRKQIAGKSSNFFVNLLSHLLEIEAALKKGISPSDAFKDNLLTQ